MSYVAVWAALALLTLAEAALAWVHAAPALMLTLLLALSFAKAGLIAWWFMHLRTRLPKALLFAIPMLFLCIGLLFALLPDGIRAGAMR
ncbi:MAG TPA: cytochrome C oxidase subunit IV family protein [Bryobacteraceae bacterium]|nr:cytochrome C oxidase subunit IV family protein [Bryobacteraceae bacterium]